ncbi:fatty acid desaturase family protein [Actinokineospora pegani]|uniref:fatty acid desaturase family protein n=1 Tax=Actinokineospora pegani TaxID=2654637 RepID=UPI0012EAF316|nr:acyl-CoA desaturase [Actinokineospora pegani]
MGQKTAKPTPYDPDNPLYKLSDEQLAGIAREFDALHDQVFGELGEVDARYIRSMITFHRRLALASRAVLLFSRYKPAWLLGTAGLGIAKILENMEIGHNVMHGQWDWMNDPNIHSSTWDWDTASPAAAWKHSHNYVHHTYTNVIGKDKDVGYEIMRVDARQKWHPVYLAQPLYNIVLMAFFEWGVALHDLDFEAIRKGRKSKKQLVDEFKAIGQKARRQVLKDYLVHPALAGRKGFKSTLLANFTANIIRNVWSHAIIFCGHFPDQTFMFTEEEVADESRGAWYVRQLIGAANIEGGPLFHVMAGNLSFQVEHHLFPDMPSSRYQEIAPKVREICERYGLPYNTGPLGKQWGAVQRTILRLAFPGGGPRPKPGPHTEPPEVKARREASRDKVPAFP